MAEVEAGFAKLQGEDFEYYMQTYSIVLGRNSKKSSVDVDLTTLGGAMNISRHHARIFYDFHRRRFALEVIGKNGCLVEGVLHLPGNPPVKLDSQDLLQIGDKKFYFLLPVRSILQPSFDRSRPPSLHLSPPVAPPPGASNSDGPSLVASAAKKGHGRLKLTTSSSPADYEHGPANKRARKGEGLEKSLGFASTSGSGGNGSKATPTIERKKEAKVRIDKGGNSHHLLQQEEKDVVSCVATVLSDLCGPGEWMSMEKLHSELIEQYNGIWPPSRVRRYLTSDDCLISEAKGRPWFGLLTLLRKCPEHFVINTKSRGKTSSEFVSLVSLLS